MKVSQINSGLKDEKFSPIHVTKGRPSQSFIFILGKVVKFDFIHHLFQADIHIYMYGEGTISRGTPSILQLHVHEYISGMAVDIDAGSWHTRSTYHIHVLLSVHSTSVCGTPRVPTMILSGSLSASNRKATLEKLVV